MHKKVTGVDLNHYGKLLAGVLAHTQRLQLVGQLIEQRAMERLEAQRTSHAASAREETTTGVFGLTKAKAT
jgi:hypothetical protein